MEDLDIGIPIEEPEKPEQDTIPKEYRRKWKRFIVQTGPIVVLHLPRLLGLAGEKTIELGPIINISEGGLMVQFIENKERNSDCKELSIQVPGRGFTIKKISYEIVREIEVGKLPDGRKIRNRSIKFNAMTPPQLLLIKDLIKNFTSDYQKDRRSGKERRVKIDPDYFDEEWRIKVDRRKRLDRRQYPAVANLKKSLGE